MGQVAEPLGKKNGKKEAVTPGFELPLLIIFKIPVIG
jgi:hypothetical protein